MQCMCRRFLRSVHVTEEGRLLLWLATSVGVASPALSMIPCTNSANSFRVSSVFRRVAAVFPCPLRRSCRPDVACRVVAARASMNGVSAYHELPLVQKKISRTTHFFSANALRRPTDNTTTRSKQSACPTPRRGAGPSHGRTTSNNHNDAETQSQEPFRAWCCPCSADAAGVCFDNGHRLLLWWW